MDDENAEADDADAAMDAADSAREYALVEIFGHRSHYAEISDVERAGAKLLRVHDVDTDQVHFYGGAAIFSMTVISKARIDAHIEERAQRKKMEEDREARWRAEEDARKAARALPRPDEDDDKPSEIPF